MWTDEQWALLMKYISNNDIELLKQLADDFLKTAEQYSKRAESLKEMAKRAEEAQK